jgi:predicted ATPase with chaperone activity
LVAKVISSTVVGVDSYPVDVEVDISPGLPDVAVEESKGIIKAAIKNSGYKFPNKFDIIDIHIEVPSVRYKDLAGRSSGEASGAIKERIERARSMQERRFADRNMQFNARMSDKAIKLYCAVDEESQKLIEMAIEKLGPSARAYTKVLKIARTIADIE